MSFVAYLRFCLPHLDARRVRLRWGPFVGSYWVGFTSAGQPEAASRYVGLVLALSEEGALRGAQRAYSRWYESGQPVVT